MEFKGLKVKYSLIVNFFFVGVKFRTCFHEGFSLWKDYVTRFVKMTYFGMEERTNRYPDTQWMHATTKSDCEVEAQDVLTFESTL